MVFSKTIFEPLVHRTFTLHLAEGQALEMHLDSLCSRQCSPRYESFVLNFTPPDGAMPLPDGSYLLSADGFGPEWIYISATHTGVFDPGSYYYESVFNVPL